MKPPETKWDGIASSSTFQAFSRRLAIENPELVQQWESLPPGSCHGVSVGLIWIGAGSGSSLSDESKYEYRNGKLYQKITARNIGN